MSARRFVGRNAELASFDAASIALCDGRGGVVVVHGPAGQGRSALLEAAADRMSGGRVLVRSLRIAPHLDTPLSPFDQVVDVAKIVRDDAVDEPLSLPPVLNGPPQARQRALARRIADTVATSTRRPTALFIDDFQDATALAWNVLDELCSAIVQVPLLVVAAVRGSDIAVDPAGNARPQLVGARIHTLGPLESEAADELVGAIAGGRPDERLAAHLERANGNPLLLTSLLDGLAREDRLERHGDVVAVRGELAAPGSLRTVVMQRLGRLADDVREIITIGAVLGQSFPVTDLLVATGRSATDVLPLVNEALAEGVLTDLGDELGFRHALIRDLVAAEVPAPVRRSMHREVAIALTEQGASPLRVAAHWAEAGDLDETPAIEALAEAGRSLALTSPETALVWFDRALALCSPRHSITARLAAERLGALTRAGRIDEALTTASELVHELPDREPRHEARRDHAVLLLLVNRAVDAASVLEELAPDLDDPAIGWAEAAVSSLAAADPVRAARNCDRVDASGSSNAMALSLTETIRSRLASHDLALDRSLEHARRAVRLADEDRTRTAHEYLPIFFQGLIQLDADLHDELQLSVEMGRAVAERFGVGYAAPLHDTLEASSRWRCGEVRAARTLAEGAVALSEDIGSRVALAWAHALASLASLAEDDLPAAASHADRAEAEAANSPLLLGADLVILARACVREAEGDLAGATELLASSIGLFTSVPLMVAQLAPDLVRFRIRAAETWDDELGSLLSAAADATGLAGLAGIASVASGAASGSIDAVLRGAEQLAASPRRLEAAHALSTAGLLAARTEDSDRARSLLRQALDAFDGCGAVRDRERTRAALRAAGGRPGSARKRTSGESALSPREADVASLVAEGLSNADIAERLFISKRTVETHLQRIFSKLGMTSRVELAVHVHEASDAGP